jgi:hypothetical protein
MRKGMQRDVCYLELSPRPRRQKGAIAFTVESRKRFEAANHIIYGRSPTLSSPFLQVGQRMMKSFITPMAAAKKNLHSQFILQNSVIAKASRANLLIDASRAAWAAALSFLGLWALGFDRSNDGRRRIDYSHGMKRDAIVAELMEIEGMLQDDRLNDHERVALHGAQQALRNVLEPDTWHPASQTFCRIDNRPSEAGSLLIH